MWKARTKKDLIIEVWEWLDCESVGAKEIKKIEDVIVEQFGQNVTDNAMIIARILADEGAELRHAEIMSLYLENQSRDEYEPMFRNILKFADFSQALNSIKNLENLRKKFLRELDKEGSRRIKEAGIKGRERTLMISKNNKVSADKRAEKAEIAEWFRIWLQNPEIFDVWVQIRMTSDEFKEKFKKNT